MCGTTRKEDAAFAASLGVDALGFIFTQKSPRYIEPEQAQQLIAKLPPFIARVGVFVNSSLTEIKEITDTAGLTQVQLHGSETADFSRLLLVARFAAKNPSCARSGVSHLPAPKCVWIWEGSACTADDAGTVETAMISIVDNLIRTPHVVIPGKSHKL